MERKLVTIQKIEEIKPIPGADKIEALRIKEWWVVAQKGQGYEVGGRVLFFEIDSFLPDLPQYEFLKKGSSLKRQLVNGEIKIGIRLKTIKLRGQISQGLVMPESVFPKCDQITSKEGKARYEEIYPIGYDITEAMDVIKYEPPVPAELAGVAKGFFPSFLRKTDEERVQNIGDILKSHIDEQFYVTEKLDGASMTVYKKDGALGVCSCNLEYKESETNTLWKLAKEYDLLNQLPDNFAVQGECVGSSIQGNPYNMQDQDFFVYNVFDITKQEYLDYDAMKLFCEERGLSLVPLIDSNFYIDEFYTKAENLLAMAEGASYLNESVRREGIVIRPIVEKKEMIGGSLQRFSFKVISNSYLLAENE